MDKNQKEIELKKIEIENLKIKEGIFRTLSIILLTVGAGIGSITFKMNINGKIYEYMLYLLLFIFSAILIFNLYLWLSIRKSIKEIEKWLKQ